MRRYTLRRSIWAGLFATMIAVVANLLYYWITKGSGEAYLVPLDANGTQLVPMPAALPVIGALFIGLLATIFFWLLIRRVRKPVTVFVSVGITALILSFGGPFGMPGTDLKTKILLSGMNVLTGVIVVGGILLFGRVKNKSTKLE